MTDSDDTITWRQLLAETTRVMGDRNHARWLCEVASGCDADELRDQFDEPATHRAVVHLDAMIARRLAGEPLQYVLGRWQFRHLDLMIDRRVLIPRPETEWVGEVAITIARAMGPSPSRPLRIADLGTGSGALGLSLAAELPVGSTEVWLTDVSQDALDVATANLAGLGRAGAGVRVGCGSWFEALPVHLRGSLDLVVSNPPYIAAGDPAVERSVLDHEPHLALFAADDGLADIGTIASGAVEWLRPGGALVVEIGAGQGPAAAGLLRAAGLVDVEIRQDLAGLDRIASGVKP